MGEVEYGTKKKKNDSCRQKVEDHESPHHFHTPNIIIIVKD